MSYFELPQQEKEISGLKYRTTAFTAKSGIDLMKRLIKVAGPSLAAMFEGDTNRGILDDDGPITKAVKLLVDNLDKDDVSSLIVKLLEKTKCRYDDEGYQEIKFDTHFAGRYSDLFQVLAFVVEVNGFFPHLSGSSESSNQ